MTVFFFFRSLVSSQLSSSSSSRWSHHFLLLPPPLLLAVSVMLKLSSLFLLFLLLLPPSQAETETVHGRSHLPVQLHVTLFSSSRSSSLSSSLRKSLQEVMPHFLPHPSSEIDFRLTHSVEEATEADSSRLLTAYKSSFRSSASSSYYSVPTSSVSNFLQHMQREKRFLTQEEGEGRDNPTSSLHHLPVWIILPGAELPPHKIWSEDNDHCFQTFLGDVIFIDLSSAACDLSPEVTGRSSLAGSSAADVWSGVFSALDSSHLKEKYDQMYLLSRLNNLIVSAAKKFLASSIKYHSSHSAGKILAPVVFLTSKSSVDADESVLSHVSLSPAEVSFLTAYVESFLLPHQEVQVLSSTHYVEDHPQLSLALASSARTFHATSLENSVDNRDDKEAETADVLYLDSENLLTELSKTGDSLCQRLLLDAGHGLEDDLLLEVESIFQNLRSGAKESSKLERWMEDNDPHNYAIAAHDNHNSRYVTSHERTRVIPVFVLSDVFTLQSQVDETSQRIFTKVPLFDLQNLVSSRPSASLVLHSTAYNTNIFQPNIHTGGWTEVDLSDPTLLIAEALAGSLGGLISPHIRDHSHHLGVSGLQHGGDADFAWGAGDHPFAPFSFIHPTWKDSVDKKATPRFSGVLSWASRRGIVISRTNAVLHRLYRFVDRAVLFVKDINRVLSLFYNIRELSEAHEDENHRSDPEEWDRIEYHNEEIEKFISVLFVYDLRGGEDSEEGEGLHIDALLEGMDEYKILLKTVLQRVLDVKGGLSSPHGDLLHTTEQLARVEMEIHEYRDKFVDSERQLKEVLGRCDFKPNNAGSVEGRPSSLGSQLGKVAVFLVSITIFVLILKKVQEMAESKAKKMS